MTDAKIEVQVPVKAQPSADVLSYVSPAELCDTQTKNMAYDAFAVFSQMG